MRGTCAKLRRRNAKLNDIECTHTEAGTCQPSGSSSLCLPSSVAVTFRAQVSNPAPVGTSLSNRIDLQDQIMSYTIPPAVIRLPYRLYLPIIMKSG